MTAARNGIKAVARNPSPKRERRQPPVRLSVVTSDAVETTQDVAAGQAASAALSIRAENVLKLLAPELTGEQPPPGRWLPSGQLLEMLTYRHLLTARNCGPRTMEEIVKWAEARGKLLRPAISSGRSLAGMWQHTIARFSAGEISTAEIAEALEHSMRRRNTRIPVELQKILLQLIRPASH